MLKFTYKQKIRERITAKCGKHPRYNPERDGRDGIKGGCTTCWQLYDLDQARIRLDTAVHDFVRRAAPWSAPVKRRATATARTAETPQQAN
ncbi:MAG: hypothetical protein WB424_02765 [Terracidiphilus sp.]|jgi:hypothetical protein